jgi:hypothetical protein
MKYMKYLAMLTLLTLPLAYSQAQVRVGVGIGLGPAYLAGPPLCAYGYYGYYPYACAPRGYYSPRYFVNGVFIGAGPWFRGWGRPYYGPRVYDRGAYSRGFVARPLERHEFAERRFEGRAFRDYRGNRGFHNGRR